MASSKSYVHLDMNGNEIQNVLLQKLASAPTTNVSSGRVYYNTTDNKLYVYDGTNWVDLTSQGNYTFTNGIQENSRVVSIKLATGSNAGNVTFTADANGLSGTVAAASTSAAGVIEIATDTEASTGTSETLAVNPKQLATKVTANSAITGATKTKITYDSKGLVTSGADLEASDIPNLTSTKINALTDYTKGSTATAIATTDTLNSALSKLENQIDAKVTGNTAITGATKCKITYDSKGLVTSGADLADSDIPNLSLSKITDVTATAAEVNVLDGITASTAELNYTDGVTSNIQTQLDSKLAAKPDGTNNLIDSGNKIATTYLPDVVMGQMLYAGTVVPSTGVATLTTNAKTKLGTTSNTITLTNDTTAITGYAANDGNYYICSADGTFANISFLVGDWLVSTGSGWKKIDNTDAVTGVKGNAESTYRIGNVNITADNVMPTQSGNSGKFLTTDGTNVSWGTVDAFPTQSGNNGKFLTTNGSTTSWADAVTPSGTQTLTNKTIDADDNTIQDLTTSNLKSGVLQTTIRASSSASDTALASEKAIATGLEGKSSVTFVDWSA